MMMLESVASQRHELDLSSSFSNKILVRAFLSTFINFYMIRASNWIAVRNSCVRNNIPTTLPKRSFHQLQTRESNSYNVTQHARQTCTLP